MATLERTSAIAVRPPRAAADSRPSPLRGAQPHLSPPLAAAPQRLDLQRLHLCEQALAALSVCSPSTSRTRPAGSAAWTPAARRARTHHKRAPPHPARVRRGQTRRPHQSASPPPPAERDASPSDSTSSIWPAASCNLGAQCADHRQRRQRDRLRRPPTAAWSSGASSSTSHAVDVVLVAPDDLWQVVPADEVRLDSPRHLLDARLQ